ncbi:MAG: hypothetical protein ACR2K1_12075 [Saprospiraceae bacterium]
MMIKIDDTLKKAICGMPVAEKDKILLRLVAKDELLVKKLEFELLEKGETTDERRGDVQRTIEKILIRSQNDAYSTPGYLLMDLRSCNAMITEHVKITKDKFGEVTLTIYMLRRALEIYAPMLEKAPARRFDTLAPYVAKRIAGILVKAEKLHEDLHLEFRRDLNTLLNLTYALPPLAAEASVAGVLMHW